MIGEDTDDELLLQLRLEFPAPTSRQRWNLAASGRGLSIRPVDDDFALCLAWLATVGVAGSTETPGRVRVEAGAAARLLELPESVELVCDADAAALLALLREPPISGFPALVELDSPDDVSVTWTSGGRHLSQTMAVPAVPALLALGVPLVASDGTWRRLLDRSALPVTIGRARMNLDGFVEIAAALPQRVEEANIPGLFRLDGSHFGVAAGFAGALDAVPGLAWAAPRPVASSPRLAAVPMPLTAHAADDLSALAGSLAARRAQAVVWAPGLGRRVFCLAAVEALDAYPLLIVAPPHAVWLWQRHAALLGRPLSLARDSADVHLVTYRDLAARARVPTCASVLFDSPMDALASERIRMALHRLDGVADAYRLACLSDLPEDPEELVALMSLLRPVEFSDAVPLPLRYPQRPEERLREHVSLYVSRRDQGDASGFRRSRVDALSPTAGQLDAVEDAYASIRDDMALLAELAVLVSAGQDHELSPKVTRAAELAAAAVEEGRSVAVATRHERTAGLLAALLRGIARAQAGSTVEVVRFGTRLPDLRRFDEVVLVDYPWSSTVVDDAVGSAADQDGPAVVTLLHLEGTLDDRMAMLAARRRERAEVSDEAGPPSLEEVSYLLRRRSR